MKRLTRDNTVRCDQRYRVFEPAITVDPGETIVVETVNHMTPIVRSEKDLHRHGAPEYREREETGPIYVRGARRADMLAIHIENIELVGLPHAHGSGPLRERCPQDPMLIPLEGGRCKFPGGLSAPVATMVGDIYTTPAELTPTFYDHGGNMDFTEIRPGNTLYLPVFREGGLLVLGDVHALQGDGEVFGEGAECAADVTLRLEIDRTYCHPRPLLETRDRLITLAGRGNLYDSVKLATEDMTALLARLHGIRRDEAYIFCCLVGSLRLAGCLARREGTEKYCLVGLSVPKQVR
ncbi:MAG: acetamidase/formamidase family protein [Phycisphaerae bacterium]